MEAFIRFLTKIFGGRASLPPQSPKAPDVPTVPISSDDTEYRKMFDSMRIRAEWRGRVDWCVNLILKHRARYEFMQAETGVPWYMVGVMHLLEGSCNFGTHLHNGDTLKARTTHVPAGRPKTGNPPFTWEESAEDALAYDSIKPPLETIGQQFAALERFNGMGYRKKGVWTPYLWSGSEHYARGKYVSDGKYDPLAVSDQVGAACVYRVLQERGILKF